MRALRFGLTAKPAVAVIAAAASSLINSSRSAHHLSGGGLRLDTDDLGPRMSKKKVPAHRHRRSSSSVALQEAPPTGSEDAVAPSAFTGQSSPAVAPRQQQQHLPSSLPLDAYAATLSKPLVPRHGKAANRSGAGSRQAPSTAPSSAMDPTTAAEQRELADLVSRDGYDPATVIRVNKRTRQIHLNSIQSELVWSARRREYQALLEGVVTCLQSHRTPIEKCFTLLALHDSAIQQRLRLRTDTYEDIFHTFYAVAVQTQGATGHTANSAQAALTAGCAWLEEELCPSGVAAASGLGSVPAELATTAAASQALLTPHFIGNLWQMYRYMIDSGTDPSPRIVQYVMGILEHAVAHATRGSSISGSGGGSANAATTLLEAKAHSLLMDLDRFQLPSTEYTVNSYIGVCDGCGVMHLAVARVADFQSRHERQSSSGTYAKLITGLVRGGQHHAAMAVVSTMQSVAMTAHLLNAVLQAARFSPDPLSVFTFYRAAVRQQGSVGLRPTQVTFSILLEVVFSQLATIPDPTDSHDGIDNSSSSSSSRADQRKVLEANLDFLLREMRRHRVRGNGLFLNKLLRIFYEFGREKEAAALRGSMEAKGVRVFDELRAR